MMRSLSNARRARRRLIYLALGVALVVVAVGLGVAALTGPDSTNDPQSARPTPSEPTDDEAPSPGQSADQMTPETAPVYTLVTPRSTREGFSLGFPNDGIGVMSAAVHQWEETPFLDDEKARRHMQLVVSKDTPEHVDEVVSKVRKTREAAGLPSSGAIPKELTVTTTVNAVRSRALTKDSEVVEVWLSYDLHSTVKGKPTDDPLLGQEESIVLKWESGDWKRTSDPEYVKRGTVPAPYKPDSPTALEDGWRQVPHGS